MTSTPNLTKIQNWIGNNNIFEIIKDRQRIDTIVKDIDNEDGHVNIEVLQFVNIFSLYQKLEEQRKAIVHQISQTDDWGLRLKIGEELTIIENEEKQFLKNVLNMAHTFTNMKLQGVIEEVAELFFKGNVEKANKLLNSKQLTNEQDKGLQLVQEKIKLEQVYDKLEDNANEFRVKAQLTVLNLDIVDADDRFEKAVFYFGRGQLSAEITERDIFVAAFSFQHAYFLHKNNQFTEAVPYYNKALLLEQELSQKNPNTHLPKVSVILNSLGIIFRETETENLRKAEKCYKESLKILKTLEEKFPNVYQVQIADLLSNIANLYKTVGNLKKAKSIHEEAVTIRTKIANINPSAVNIHRVIISYINIGNVYNNQSKDNLVRYKVNIGERYFKKALNKLDELEKISSKDYQSDIAMVLTNLADIQCDKAIFDKKILKEARNNYQKALKIRRGLSKKHPQVYSSDLARTLVNFGLLENNIEFYEEALSIYEKLAKTNPKAYLRYIGIVYKNIADFYYLKGDMKLFKKNINESISILLQVQNIPYYKIELDNIRQSLNNIGIDGEKYIANI